MLWFPKCMCFGKSGKSDSCYSSAEQTTVNGRPSSQTSNNNVASKPRKKLFLGLKRKPPPNTNPPLPQKPQHFNPENIPNIDDPIPTYESVDVADSDVAYSRVHERPRRYEYPTFNRTRASEEAVYASASQIYSGGSEDPYSSIVSDIEGKKADDTSVGYARVQDDLTQPSTSRAVRNVESLYAKINRNSINRKMSENNPRRPEVLSTEIRAPVPSTSASVPQPMEHTASVQTHTVEPLFEPVYQYEGSITSTESRNPSYKYLTVRETLGAIRERIRAREEGLQQNPPSREHYYSTIQNDYETVKDVRAPLSVITDSNSNPRPPTSPVPSHVPPMT
ncbi:unnamed protein product [Bursaphelenchus okinawaensis]|uniref:Uncharacterized protein n=1 Tax=Bursaphelenchus okinawaensis TaxID=465554 RepID=A0A811LI41_9BILA|nr:unnamed protein product [Bursaphelenchus okinawaensis]CAG9126121.1 unnamed protein product [Bursaphelenchus okinawaensis]